MPLLPEVLHLLIVARFGAERGTLTRAAKATGIAVSSLHAWTASGTVSARIPSARALSCLLDALDAIRPLGPADRLAAVRARAASCAARDVS